MQGPGHRQAERLDRRGEAVAVAGLHAEAAMHAADRGGQHAAAGVGVALSGLQQRLLADHARTADLLHLGVAVGDDPVPGQQLGGQQPAVADGHRVGEGVALLVRQRLLGQVASDDADVDLVTRVRCGHCCGGFGRHDIKA
ncbi:hypothetical protein D3C71_1746100 [compost metagenome]